MYLLVFVDHNINKRFIYTHQSWPRPQQALKRASLQQHCWGRIPDEPPALHNTTLGPSQTVIFCYTLCLHFQRGKHLFLHTRQSWIWMLWLKYCNRDLCNSNRPCLAILYLHCQPRRGSHGLSAWHTHIQTGLAGWEWSDSLADNNPAEL